MLARFFAPDLVPGAREARLPADESRHLARVMRLGPGDEVAVFDGRGHEFRARVVDNARSGTSIEVLEPIAAAPEPRVALTLAQAVLKGEKMDDVVRDATMMGASAIDPLVTAHTIARRQSADRWQRVALASVKQCRRAVVPRIGAIRTPAEWLATASYELKLLLVEPASARAAGGSLRDVPGRNVASVALIVGPEGGWAPQECDAFIAAGCVPVTLGGLTLRGDAVPIVAMSIVRFALGDL